MSTTKSIRIYDKEFSPLLKYPFKSKYKHIDSIRHIYRNDIKTEPFIPDFKLKSCKQLSKPNFSHEPGCWEVDLMFTSYYSVDGTSTLKVSRIYLIMINVNSRYLIVEPILEKNDISNALKRVIEKNPKYDFRTIKCDGESGFVSLKDECIVLRCKDSSVILETNLSGTLMKRYKMKPDLRSNVRDIILHEHDLLAIREIYPSINSNIIDYYPINFVINSSPYTLAHKTVDSVIRTIRNAFGMNNRRIADYNLMRQMVDYYNNTPHTSLRFKNYEHTEYRSEYQGSGLIPPSKWVYYSPAQVQNNIDLEWKYIRKMKLKLREINDKQRFKGLLSYRRGNIILIHLDRGKTQKKHEKRRRVFDEIAVFIRYENGNVICKLLNPYRTYSKSSKGLVPYDQMKSNEDITRGRIPKNDFQKSIIEVPIIYTKYVCNSINELDEDFRHYFVINDNDEH